VDHEWVEQQAREWLVPDSRRPRPPSLASERNRPPGVPRVEVYWL
jgi:hypothetical protein